MLTAAHCQEAFFYTRAGAFVGRTHKINTRADVQMLVTGSSGQPYSNRIFNGAWNTRNSYAVRNGGNPSRGMRLCLSGGMSGSLCGLEIVETDVSSSNGRGPGFFFRDADDARGCALQGGDSGSPLHMPAYSDGSVTVAGIAIEGDLEGVPCPRHPIYPANGTSMYRLGFATRISSVTAAFSPPVGLATVTTGIGGGTG